jgi:hypothetical protein
MLKCITQMVFIESYMCFVNSPEQAYLQKWDILHLEKYDLQELYF